MWIGSSLSVGDIDIDHNDCALSILKEWNVE